MNQELRANHRTKVYTKIANYILNTNTTVHINTLYEMFGKETFTSKQYFVRSFLDMVKFDSRIRVRTAKRLGTYAAPKGIKLVIPQRNTPVKRALKKVVRMGGNFGIKPYIMTGSPVMMEIDEAHWKKCKTIPKAFNEKGVIEVYRWSVKDIATEYLQVTKTNQYHFTVNV
jgi:hypothetical protein